MLTGTLRRRRPPLSPSPRSAALSRLVLPRRPRHWVGASWCFGRWVGFRPLLPAPVCPPPVSIRMLWGIQGFRLHWVPHPLWVSSHPMTTRLPLRLLLESSHLDMTRLPLPLRWGSSHPDMTQPPRPLGGGLSRPETIRPPPPHSVATPPGVFLHSGGLTDPLLPLHSVGVQVHSGGLAAPRVSPYSPGLCSPSSPLDSFFVLLLPPLPMAATRRRLVGCRGGDVPTVTPAGPRNPS